MDSIFGLLIVLIPVVFTLIGRKLDNAGKEGGNVADVPPMPEDVNKPEVVEEAVRALPAKPPKSPKKKAKTYDAKEEAKPKKKDPIDPKKLVIYSEIMKPKF